MTDSDILCETHAVRALRDSVEISAGPERVWSWLVDLYLPGRYREWHPDHVSATWVSGPPNRVGSVLEAVEYLGGRRETMRFELTAVDPPRRLAYRMRGPISALLPRGAFLVEPIAGGSRFQAIIEYRFGKLTEVLFRRRVAALRTHMHEEGVNVKRILESGRE